MRTLVRVLGCVALVGLLQTSLRAETLFYDGFEKGTAGTALAAPWTLTAPTNTYPTLKYDATKQKVGAQSAMSSYNGNGNRAPLSREADPVNGKLTLEYWLYDATGEAGLTPATQAYATIRAYSDTGTLQQYLAIGRYNNSSTGLPAMGNYYAGRIVNGAGAGWFPLDAAGIPVRSQGWHKFTLTMEQIGAGITAKFFVDGILGKQVDGILGGSFDTVTMGNALGSTAQVAWYDDVTVSQVPEPGTVAMLASGLICVAGTVIARRRRTQAAA